MRVRLQTTVSISLRLALALFVVLGTSGHAFSAILCALGNCGPECAMRNSEPKSAMPAESCCASQEKSGSDALSQPRPDCDCQLTAPAESQAASVPAPAPVEPIFALALPTPPQLSTVLQSFDEDTIQFSGDLSPPDIVRHPDRGRAPPIA